MELNRFCFKVEISDNPSFNAFAFFFATNSQTNFIAVVAYESATFMVCNSICNQFSKRSSESTYTYLEKHLSIISMILALEMNDTTLELTVNTTDNLYIDLVFDNPQLILK